MASRLLFFWPIGNSAVCALHQPPLRLLAVWNNHHWRSTVPFT